MSYVVLNSVLMQIEAAHIYGHLRYLYVLYPIGG